MQYVSSLYHKFLYLENLFILIVLSVRGLTQIFSFKDTVNKPKTTTTEQELLDLTNEVRKTFFNNSTSILLQYDVGQDERRLRYDQNGLSCS